MVDKIKKLREFEDALSDLVTEILPLKELTDEEIKDYFGDKTIAEFIIDIKIEVEEWSR